MQLRVKEFIERFAAAWDLTPEEVRELSFVTVAELLPLRPLVKCQVVDVEAEPVPSTQRQAVQ